MKEFIISEAQTEKAVLVGLITPEQNEQKVREYLDELAFLADTAGVEAVKRFYQKLDYPNSVTFVGSGKLQEIKEYVVENEIGLVIFDDELSAKQLRNIDTCRVRVSSSWSMSSAPMLTKTMWAVWPLRWPISRPTTFTAP